MSAAGNSPTPSAETLDPALPYAYGQPDANGQIKDEPEDFAVEEILGFPLTGDGEHVCLHIEKTGENTEYLARQLARFAGVPLLNIGYAGLKDRQARTRQWFSVGLAGQPEPQWSAFESPTMKILDIARHRRKLKRGDLAGNRFRIIVRAITGAREPIEQRLGVIARCGVPNYFGPQRFGWEGGNLEKARGLLLGSLKVPERHLRSLYLSAARSYLFNRILGLRVDLGLWNRTVPGDALMGGADDRPSQRWPEPDVLAEQMNALKIHPAGTLWGRGRCVLAGEAEALEQQALQGEEALCRALENAGLDRAMRPLRAPVGELSWQFPDAVTLELRFSLPPGSYATSVLREIVSDPGIPPACKEPHDARDPAPASA